MKLFFILAFAAFALVSCARSDANDRRPGQLSASAAEEQPGGDRPSSGRGVFLKNCAHCHGADARGNEGPDLHNLDWTDQQIATRIRNGKKGQMTAFEGKLTLDEINAVIAYLHTLK